MAIVLATATPAFAQDATADAAAQQADAAAQQAKEAAAAAAAAQQAADQASASPQDQTKQASVVVTGFRAALRTATAKKKNSETVVESVSAEDIGKLPDNGIGESIARLPGIAAQRSNGRANIISIRGFGPDFSTTTLNGRQQTTTNDSRAVEFDQYPSEILSGVDVYKTAEADHTAGGLVGSIDLRTIRPLDYGKRVIAVGVRGTYVDQKVDPNSKDLGGRVFGTFVDQFANDTMGLAVSAAYTNEPYQTRDWNAWGYGSAPGGGAQIMSGIKTWNESDQLKRFGGTATFQARLSDNLTTTLDGFYSHFTDNIDQRGFEMPFNGPISDVTSADGIVTGATIAGTPVIENYATDHKADIYSFGWNTMWDGHNGWRAMADLSWSRTDRNEHHLETTAGLAHGPPSAPSAIVSYSLTDHGPVFVSDYDGTSSDLVLTDVQGWSGAINQAGYDKLRKSRDDLKEARGEIERELGGFLKSVKIGVDYTDRDKKLSQDEAFLSPPGGADVAVIPSDLLLEPVDIGRGLGSVIAYDPRKLVGAGVLDFQPNSSGANAGYHVTERVLTPYAMASLDAQLGAAKLTGNIGVQGVHTSVTSESLNFPTTHDRYWMFLPSLNLNLRWDNGFVIRFAASKEYMRARLTDMNNIIFNSGPNISYNPVIYTGNGGNPYLRPFQAKAVDLNLEKYFGSRGYIALQTFYKHIDTYIAGGHIDFDFTGYPPPEGSTIVPTSPVGILFTNANTRGGYMYGAELAGTLPFDVFSQSLSGFGLTGGIGYTKTHVLDFDGNTTTIPGYSKWVGNLTAFFEQGGFSVRGSMRYRSTFQGDFVLFSGGLDRQQVLAETTYDAQVGYDFPQTSGLAGLSLYVQGQNLTNERSATIAIPDQPNSWFKYQTYGRRFLAGATFKFGAGRAVLPPPPPPAPPPPPPAAPATQTCADGSVILATDGCPVPPPPPPPPAPAPERGL